MRDLRRMLLEHPWPEFAALQAEELEAEQNLEMEVALEELLPLDSIQHLNFYPDDVERLVERADQIEQTVQGMK